MWTRPILALLIGAAGFVSVGASTQASQIIPNCFPVIEVPDGYTIQVGQQIMIQVELSPGCGDSRIRDLTFASESLPLGLRVDAQTGRITGTVQEQTFNPVNWRIRIDYLVSASAAQPFSASRDTQITTSVIATPPTVAPTPVPTVVPTGTAVAVPVPLPTVERTPEPAPTQTPRPTATARPEPEPTRGAIPGDPQTTPQPPVLGPTIDPDPSLDAQPTAPPVVGAADEPIEAMIGDVPVLIWFVPHREMRQNEFSDVTVRVVERRDDHNEARPDFGAQGTPEPVPGRFPASVEVQLTTDDSIAAVVPGERREVRLVAPNDGGPLQWENTWRVYPIKRTPFTLLLEVFEVGSNRDLSKKAVEIKVNREAGWLTKVVLGMAKWVALALVVGVVIPLLLDRVRRRRDTGGVDESPVVDIEHDEEE